MISISTEVLADLLQQSPEQITTATKDGEEFKSQGEIDQWIKSAFDDKVNSDKQAVRDSMYLRGKKEALTAKERELRKLFEEFDPKGSNLKEMLEDAYNRKVPVLDMTPDNVRASEIYKVDRQKLLDQLAANQTEKEQVVKDYRTKEVNFKARQAGLGLLKKHKFVTPDWAVDDTMLGDLLFSKLNSSDASLGLNEKGDLIVVDKDGNQKMDDKTVSPISFETHFVETAKRIFKIAESDGRQSPGNQGSGSGNGQASSNNFAAIKSDDDYLTRLNGMKSKEDRDKFNKFYADTFEAKSA